MESVQSESYESHLFSHLPIFTTRLVREHEIAYQERVKINTAVDAVALLRRYFEDKDREELVVLLIDSSNTAIGLAQVSVGGLVASVAEPAQIFKPAILANACSFILAHNHPSGNPEPSRQDISITRQLVKAGSILEIKMHDHIVIGHRGFTSLAERGLM